MSFLSNYLLKHESKLVGVGLGAQTLINGEVIIPQGTLDWLKLLQSRSPTDNPNIGVRGQFTYDVLRKYGLEQKAVILGCPSFYISPERNLGKKIAENWNGMPSRIAVTAGHPGWRDFGKLESSLCQLLTLGSDYIIQSPNNMIAIGRGLFESISEKDLYDIRDYVKPSLTIFQFKDWCIKHAISFFSFSAWMEHIRRFDFVVGLRIHGVIIALQMGIPALCIVHDSRTKELCETMKIPNVEASTIINGISRNNLKEYFNFDPDAFDLNRLELAKKYVDFMSSNGLNLSSKLRYLVGP